MTGTIKRVAVTGSSGLIGSAVAKALAARQITAIGIDLQDGADVADQGIGEILARAEPDAVLHAAAHPGGKSLAEPVEDARVNTLGSMRVFDWCASAHVPVVYLSSSAVYGEQPAGPIPESAPLRPGTIYAVAKVACEQWLDILGKGAGLDWTVLRLFATYGAGHKPNTYQGIVNVMLTQLLAGNRVIVRGSLERKRDLVYVADAADAIVEALVRPQARSRIMNIGTGVSVTIREIIETLCRVLGRNLADVELVEEAGTVGDPLNSVADALIATTVLGFKPNFSLEAGLRTMLANRVPAAS